MAWSWTPDRRDEPELMDAPGLPEAQVAHAYEVLTRVNRGLGNAHTLRREVDRFLREHDASTKATILDVGSGSGDLPRMLADRWGSRACLLVLDRDRTAVGLAGKAGLAVAQGDALRLPFASRSIGLVTAIKFAHHFKGAPLNDLLNEMARVADRGVLVLDIRRHWLAYYGFIAWSHVFTRDRLVRHDGPLSVLRGFTRDELVALGSAVPDFTWSVRAYPGFQLALVGRRRPDGR